MSQMGWLARQDGYDPDAFDVPLEQTYDRRFDQTWPGKLAQEAIGAVLAPGRALQSTEPITTEQMIKPAADLAGLVTGGSYAAPAQRGASGAGIRAYHSSPHDFDKFDLSKIGTGEGAQAYGHGLYFAENPAVSGQGGQYWNQFTNKFEGPEYLAAGKLKQAGFDREAAAALAQRDVDAVAEALKSGKPPPGLQGGPFDEHVLRSINKNLLYERQQELDLLRSNRPVGPRTYEVNINADPAHLLDWDKPLREQGGAVQDVYRRMMPKGTTPWGFEPKTGADFHNAAAAQAVYGTTKRKDAAVVADALREAGIPGIKYFDQGSRNLQSQFAGLKPTASPEVIRADIAYAKEMMAKAEPHSSGQSYWRNEIADLEGSLKMATNALTSNYVIFDPNIIRIDKKYALPLAAAPAGMGALAAQDRYE